jgi:riboflavin biosynthesis pyrimidine reductase
VTAPARRKGDDLPEQPDTDLCPLADAGERRPARDLVASLRLDEPRDDRPRMVAAMIASADGRAQVHGRSGGLGNPADREVFRELRTAADAILVGSRTIEVERYANLLDDHQREHRVSQGRDETPLLATVSRRLDIDLTVPLFNEPGTRIVIYTESDGSVEGCDADISVHRFAPGTLNYPAILAHLASAHGVRGVTCEGGPHLLREVVVQGCLDDLLLTVAPLLVGGDALATLVGPPLGEVVTLDLRAVHRADGHLFLHYGLLP